MDIHQELNETAPESCLCLTCPNYSSKRGLALDLARLKSLEEAIPIVYSSSEGPHELKIHYLSKGNLSIFESAWDRNVIT